MAAGRFVDAWKNKETEPVEQMEQVLSEIENYYVKLEQERLEKLEVERKNECLQYCENPVSDLAKMDDFVYSSYLKGLKEAYELRLEQERKEEEERQRQEQIKQLHEERKNKAIPYYQFWSEFEKTLNFGEQSDADFEAFMQRNITAKKEFDKEQKRIQAELAEAKRLKEEAEAKALKERKEREELERKAKAEQERLLQIEREKQRKLEQELEAQREKERKEQAEKEQKEREELQRKQEEEKQRIEAERKAKNAPDKEKLIALKNTINSIEIPELVEAEGSSIANNVKTLLGKVVAYIDGKVSEL